MKGIIKNYFEKVEELSSGSHVLRNSMAQEHEKAIVQLALPLEKVTYLIGYLC